MSLRARLILGLLACAAAGLITLAAITYVEQRSTLIQRVDQEASNDVGFVSRALDFCAPAAEQGTRCSGMPFGPGFSATVLTGTFAQRRFGNGSRHESIQFAKHFPIPQLPADIPLQQPFTVGSTDNSGVQFRVLAVRTADIPGATTIVAIPLTDVDHTLHRLIVIEALVLAGVLAALAALSWWLVRLGLRPLDRIATTAGAIAEGDLSQRVTPATERTEVGRLGLALNAMLAQIEKAFRAREASEDRLRRFLADASHELRTPLASIRGYAELFRLGAADDPEKAMRRIESEAARMGQLVENLLLLARLDEAPETTRKRVNLAELITEAVEDARAAAPERRIGLKADGSATVTGDPLQLRQVISNLLRNALVHTPAASEIDVRVASEGEDALFEVRDHGRGLPSGDTDALFERFWRAEPGRGRGAAGAGLGLSIVKAIVEGHGGRVQAANAPGGGACFTVRLPLAAERRASASVAGGAPALEP